MLSLFRPSREEVSRVPWPAEPRRVQGLSPEAEQHIHDVTEGRRSISDASPEVFQEIQRFSEQLHRTNRNIIEPRSEPLRPFILVKVAKWLWRLGR